MSEAMNAIPAVETQAQTVEAARTAAMLAGSVSHHVSMNAMMVASVTTHCVVAAIRREAEEAASLEDFIAKIRYADEVLRRSDIAEEAVKSVKELEIEFAAPHEDAPKA